MGSMIRMDNNISFMILRSNNNNLCYIVIYSYILYRSILYCTCLLFSYFKLYFYFRSVDPVFCLMRSHSMTKLGFLFIC